MSFGKSSFAALLSIGALALGVSFSPPAYAGLTVGGGGTCTQSTKCTSLKPKFCSCPQIGTGYCTSCTQACSSSCLGGSTFGLFSGAQLPVDDPATEEFNESPVFGALLSTGPSFALKCEQGDQECPLGVPVVQDTQQITIRKSNLTITLSDPIANLPPPPFKVQVAGTSFNDGVYPVVGVDITGLVLTLGQRPNRNETSTATVALANIKLTFTDKNDVEDQGRVYFRHFSDPTAGQAPQCKQVGAQCEDGVATAIGFFNAEVKCSSTGTLLKLPCDVQAFAGDGQFATFVFAQGENNFPVSACLNGTCKLVWSDAFKGNCKKPYPANSSFAECQTLKFTVTAGASISNFLQRASNSALTPLNDPVSLLFQSNMDTPGGVPVDIIAGPDPIQTGNPGSSGVLTVSILNNGAANLNAIDVNSVVLTFNFYGGAQPKNAVVQNDRAPETCEGSTDCKNFKFSKTAFLDAYLSVFTPANCTIPDNTQVPVHLVGAYTSGGEVIGETTVRTNGAYTNPSACN